jgi:2-polyprenyl-3-methyl-5-hydroxy-6-metoxy-1,4-benzoquinol methylase
VVDDVFKEGLFGLGNFDVITFTQVMEHLPDPIQALRLAYDYLRPGGMAVIDVPSYNNPRFLFYGFTKMKSIVRKDVTVQMGNNEF